MPELPEVEVTRLSFAHRIRGARVVGVRLGKPLRWPLGCEAHSLVSQVVGEVVRRGKYLWLPLTCGGLLVHLGMSGSLSFGEQAEAWGGHDHFELATSLGTLRLTDPRRFGSVVWSRSLDTLPAAKLLARLGLEPFDAAFTGAYLHAAWQRRRLSVKQALLAGDTVVGAGNIYACEALFQAGIDPRLPSCQLSLKRAQALALAVKDVLGRAITLGGSSLRDFKSAQGAQGHFQLQTKVYGRAGLQCDVCLSTIERIVQGQRATFLCGKCQTC
jgi:formamidopyrimidine-DNA glycosylase